MPFCPQCGSAVEPDELFCTSCGASLVPDLPATGPEPGIIFPAGLSSRSILVAGVVIAIVILAGVFAAYPVLSGSSAPATPATHANIEPVAGNTTGGSWVKIITNEPTFVPTTEIPVSTIPTTVLTTVTPTPPTKPVVCAADRVNCNNTCVDLRSDCMHCGLCGVECDPGQFCLNGVCMESCAAGKTSCPDGCFDLMSDKDHCGSCLNDCPRGLICYRGQCTAPATPMPVPL